MKILVLALLALACALPLQADNWLENGDFTDGISHWHGDGRPASDFAPSNPLDKADPFLSQGLIIQLKGFDWTKVAQDFKGKIADGTLSVSYKVSQDFSFSTKADDYKNMPDHIHYDGWSAFNTPVGTWVVFITDFGSARGSSYTITPKPGSTDPQNFQVKVSGLTPLKSKTITLAFPPGKGTVVLLDVSLTE